MNRGEVWTVQDGGYASKPRPAVIVQANEISTRFQSVILVGLTTHEMPDAPTRVKVEPSAQNGLKETCWAMTEKPFTVRAERLGTRIGRLEPRDQSRISKGLASALSITADDLATPD